MLIETYKAKVTHDHGAINITIVSLSGQESAISQIMKAEGCPRSSIKTIKLIKSKEV